jgi:hypothetical protein
MKKYLIILILLSAQCFSQDLKFETIPNSTLKVSFPSDWNFSTPYAGDGRYSSIQLYLPKEKNGGYPVYPEFEFEFLDKNSEDEKLRYILNSKPLPKKIGGVKSKAFKISSEVSYLRSNMSHSYAAIQMTGYLVPINKGYLICSLTTLAEKQNEHKKYSNFLEAYCIGAVASAK